MQTSLSRLAKWATQLGRAMLFVMIIYQANAQGDGLPRGAFQMPYTRYESDNTSQTQGTIARTDYDFQPDVAAAEASGQHYLELDSDGDFVQWKVNEMADGVTLRFTIPDNSAGTGNQGALNVYVNGSLDQTITLNSYWAFHYLNKFQGAQGGNIPNAGFTEVRMYFDDINFKLNTPLAPGSTIRLEKTGGNPHAYGIDFIEIEQIDPIVGPPANYLSVTDAPYNANGNDTVDDLAAFHACLADANAQGKNMYIPAGKYYLDGQFRLNASNIKVQGAGIWHTELFFSSDLAFSGGVKARANNLEFSDVHVTTNNNDRFCPDDERIPGWNEPYKGYKGIFGTWGSNCVIKNVWVEHFETGMWFADYDFATEGAPQDITSNLLITNARIRNNYADGVNFAEGSNHCTVEHTNIRNSGDDGFAVWSSDNWGHGVPGTHNVLQYSTVENVWRAGGVAFHGADGHGVNHVLIRDGRGCAGIRFTDTFPGFKFLQNNQSVMSNITIINHGTTYDLFNEEIGAIYLSGAAGLFNVYWEDIDIIDSQRHAITLEGGPYQNIEFHSLKIDGTGLDPYDHNTVVHTDGGTGIAASASGQIDLYNPQWISWETQDSIITTGNLTVNTYFTEPVGVQSIDILDGPLTLVSGQTVNLYPTFAPQNASNKAVTYTNSNPSVGNLNEVTGAFVANGVGQTTVTVTSDDNPSATDQVVINVTSAVNIEAVASQAWENGATGEFVISIDELASNLTVSYTVSGTASAGDYNASPSLSGSVTLTPSNLSQSFTITAVDDSDFEGDETVRIDIVDNGNYNIGVGSATVTIEDNENPPCAAPNVILTSSAPSIDQNIESAWDEAPSVTIGNAVIGSIGSFSGSYKAMYDNNNLYVLVQTNMEDLDNDSGAEWWNDDAIGIHIDGDNSKSTTYDGVNDFQLAFRWNDGNVLFGGNSVQNSAGINFSLYNPGSGGMTLEAAIPWSTIGVTAELGNQIGIDVVVESDGTGGARESQVTAFTPDEFAWRDPFKWASAYLTSCAPIVPEVPVINSALAITRTVGDPINYAITASGFPTSYGATNLPAGITVNGGSGVLSGNLNAVGSFPVTISATNSEGSDSETLQITVNPVAVTGVAVSPTNASVETSAITQLTASISPANATDQSVSWSTSNASVATVNGSGLVTGVSSGSAVITVTTNDGGFIATSNVQVIVPGQLPPDAIVTSSSITLPINSTSVDGSASNDPDGTITSYSWVQLSGPNSAGLSGQSSSVLNVSGLIEGSYQFELTVTDNNGNTDAAVATVTVNPESSIPADRGYYDAPYTRYEAASNNIGGGATWLSKTWDQKQTHFEASDRQCASLSSNGNYVAWNLTEPGRGIVLRFSIPDAPGGGGITGSLGLYVGGSKVQDISLSSAWAWQYFSPNPGDGTKDPTNNPGGADWTARMAFDEVRVLLPNEIAAGTEIRIQKDNGDGIDYLVDFIEVEPVGAPLPQPANTINVGDYTTPDDGIDDKAGFDQAYTAARQEGKGLYFPAGKWEFASQFYLYTDNLTFTGAGMWHTELYFSNEGPGNGGFNPNASNLTFADFSMTTANKIRALPYKGFVGNYGTGSVISNVWVEHFEVGAWIANFHGNTGNQNMEIVNCRFRNNYADGVNFSKGTSNSICHHSSFRNNGDDAMASWSSIDGPVCLNNEFAYCTAENTWRAAGVGFFGGGGHTAHHIIVKDGTEAGLRINSDFQGHTFTGDPIDFHDITVIGSGTNANLWFNRYGAIDIFTRLYNMSNVTFDNIDVLESQKDAIFIYTVNPAYTISNLTLSNITVDGTGLDGNVNNYTEGTWDDYAGYGLLTDGQVIAEINKCNISYSNTATADELFENPGNITINFCNNVPATGITVNPTTLNLNNGTTGNITATVLPADASNKSVSWSTSNASVATVSGGVVTAVGDGSAVITATTHNGFTATTQVTVTTQVVSVTGVSINCPGSINMGDQGQITWQITPANATNQGVSFASSNPSVLTVDANGLVYGVSGGSATVTITTNDGGYTDNCTINVIEITQDPYLGSPVSLPGTVEVENFDTGGEGVAYSDSNTANDGGQYRTGEGVDIEACSEGGYNVGWTNAGEWLEYTVDVTQAGTYDFEFRVASTLSGGTFHVEFNGQNVTGTVTSANTGAWQTWTSVYANGVSLNAGVQVMRIALDNPNHNLDKVIVSLVGGGDIDVTGVSVSPTSATVQAGNTQQLTASVQPTNATNQNVTWSSSNTAVATVNGAGLVTAVAAGNATITVTTVDGGYTATSAITVESAPSGQQPYLGSPVNIPGTVEVENFDTGGEGVAYHDVDANNAGGQYRTGEGVDIEVCSDGGYNVGWTAGGEWLEYTVNVASAGTYDFEFRVASINSGGTFHVEFGGQNVTGTVTSANTGGWQTWTSVYANGVSLSAGQQIMRIALDNPNHNLDKVIISSAGGGNIDVTGVSVSPTSITLDEGQTQQLTASVAPSNATNQNVSWSTSNGSVATVNSAGLVTAVAEGSATITVTTVDGGYTATTSVTVNGSSSASGYRIRNRWQNTYLGDGGANVTYSASGSGDSYVWQLEDVGGGLVEIRNVATGEYMHIENLTGSIQCTSRTFGWYSSRWAIEDVDGTHDRIRNAWQSNNYIHVENLTGNAQHGTINTAWQSAQWAFEAVGGARLSNDLAKESLAKPLEVSVYPNPVSGGMFSIELNNGAVEYEVSVIDYMGRVVFNDRFDQEKVQISTNGLGAGVYMVKIVQNDQSMVKRLLVK